MPLPLSNVNLDDRRWADLVEEGRALIPRHAPGWTDHNLSDPGITLIELFAWLTEQNVYRLNQIPERHRRKFLSLIGFPLKPPQPAQAVLAVRSWNLAPDLIPIPSGFEFEADDTEGTSVAFRTLRDLTLAPVKLSAIQVDAGDGNLVDRTSDWREDLQVAVFGDEPCSGAALYLGFKVPDDLTLENVPVSLAFHFEGMEHGLGVRTRLIEEAAQQREAQRPVLPEIHCEEEVQEPGPMLPPHHSARLVWEVLTDGDGTWRALEPVTNEVRPEPGQIWDDTRSLTLDGIVECNLPASSQPMILEPVTDALYWLRCRLEAGAYDAAPLLRHLSVNAVTAEQAVPVEHSFLIPEGVVVSGAPPTTGDVARLSMELATSGAISSLTFLEVEEPPEIVEVLTQPPELQILDYSAPNNTNAGSLTLDVVPLEIGTGRPEQEVTLPHAPVQQSSVKLYTHLAGNWTTWILRDDFDASQRTDAHFTLDATTGVIRFGDGEKGQVPETGALFLASYRSTLAEAGNLRAGANFRPAATIRNGLAGLLQPVIESLGELTYNPMDAYAGTSTETLAQATGRAVEILHAHERLIDVASAHKQRTLDQIPRHLVKSLAPPTRAVNLLDLERLALDVSGTQIARAGAWAGTHPDYPCLYAAGVVTIVVLPFLPLGMPEPGRGLLAAVRRYLDRRRMITTRLEVVGPHYLRVTVFADVRTKPLVDAARVQVQIIEAINTFLDPLEGGPEALGWPFGRDVFRSEILQLIDGVPGVDHVLDLSLIAGEGEPKCGNISLCPTWLVSPGEHQVRVNPLEHDRTDTMHGLTVCHQVGNSETEVEIN